MPTSPRSAIFVRSPGAVGDGHGMTMMLCPAPATACAGDEPAPGDAHSADGHLLLLLATRWELLTGRSCPAWPLNGVASDTLIEFWADPAMQEGR